MEVLAGARSERHLIQLRRLLARTTMLPTTPADYEAAASMSRSRRARGKTVHKLIDCLIGAVAVRADFEILRSEADSVALARHAEVRLHPH